MERNKNGTLKKGVVLNPNGRPKGALNRSTQQLKEIINDILNSELGKIDEYLNELEPKERLNFIIKLMPYVIPKQTETIIEDVTEKGSTIDYSKLSTDTLRDILANVQNTD